MWVEEELLNGAQCIGAPARPMTYVYVISIVCDM